MVWTKLPDNYPARRWDLSDAAFRLDVAALVESNRCGWDGRIPKGRLRFLVPRYRVTAVEELVAAGLWRDAGDVFVIVDDVAKDQLSPAEVERQREANRERQRRWRERQRAALLAASEGEAVTPVTPDVTPLCNGDYATHPDPTRPVRDGKIHKKTPAHPVDDTLGSSIEKARVRVDGSSEGPRAANKTRTNGDARPSARAAIDLESVQARADQGGPLTREEFAEFLERLWIPSAFAAGVARELGYGSDLEALDDRQRAMVFVLAADRAAEARRRGPG